MPYLFDHSWPQPMVMGSLVAVEASGASTALAPAGAADGARFRYSISQRHDAKSIFSRGDVMIKASSEVLGASGASAAPTSLWPPLALGSVSA